MIAAALALIALQMQPLGLVRHLDDGDDRRLSTKFGIGNRDAERIPAQIDVSREVDLEPAALAEAGLAVFVAHQAARPAIRQLPQAVPNSDSPRAFASTGHDQAPSER